MEFSTNSSSIFGFLSTQSQRSQYMDHVPNAFTTATLVGLLIIFVTRLLSGRNSPSSSHNNGASPVPRAPYWIPFVGNLSDMGWDAKAFTTRLRQRFPDGAFSLNLGGTTHNVFYHPGMATALLGQPASTADFHDVTNRLMHYVFGMPKTDFKRWDEAIPDLMACYRHILADPGLSKIVGQTAAAAQMNAPNLVTFSSSPVDEAPWERTSDARTKTNLAGEAVVEAELLPLIRDFCAHSANATLVGSDFTSNFPDYFDDLWAMDRGMLLLAAGLPRWMPILTLTRAHIGRRKMLRRLETFHTALEIWAERGAEAAGAEWRDLDDISDLLKARMQAYRKYKLSIRARAASENALLWAANANSDMLVFWMITRIYADEAATDLLARLRAEMQPYVRAVQPLQQAGMAVSEQPRFEVFDVDGLCEKCPLLKSCYIECLRLDTASWSAKVVKQDFVLQARGGDKKDPTPAWHLRKGEFAHAAHDLHNTNPKYFVDPTVWKADRHVRYELSSDSPDGKGQASAELGSVRSYGGGSSMCKGRAFAFKECMVFAAAIIAMWDFEPAGGSGQWRIPRHKKAMGVYNTSDSTRVWVKRRQLPPPSDGR